MARNGLEPTPLAVADGPDIPALARRFAALFPQHDASAGALALALYRLLAQGAPVAWSALAHQMGRPESEVRATVGAWPGLFEEPEGVTGCGGLSIRRVSSHRMVVEGRVLWARCAWDTLFLPGVLGREAEVSSVCGVTGAPVHLRVTPQAVESLEPVGTLLSMLEPQAEMKSDVTQHF